MKALKLFPEMWPLPTIMPNHLTVMKLFPEDAASRAINALLNQLPVLKLFPKMWLLETIMPNHLPVQKLLCYKAKNTVKDSLKLTRPNS